MDNTIQSFTLKGKKGIFVQMPEQIVSITTMQVNKQQNKQNLLVTLKSGEIRVYNGKTLLDKLVMNEVLNAIIYGVFGKQDSSLLINTKSGVLAFKHLLPDAKLQSNSLRPGPPPE